MINFDSLTLKALMSEIQPIIENSRVQKIRQSSRQELVLTIRNNSKNYTLFISIKPSFAHLCLLEDEFKNFRIMDFPQSPPMFCMLLRKKIGGGRLIDAYTPGCDRVLYLDFEVYNELGDLIIYTVAAEIMGRHSNIIVFEKPPKIKPNHISDL